MGGAQAPTELLDLEFRFRHLDVETGHRALATSRHLYIKFLGVFNTHCRTDNNIFVTGAIASGLCSHQPAMYHQAQ